MMRRIVTRDTSGLREGKGTPEGMLVSHYWWRAPMPNGLEVSRPPSQARVSSLYGSLAGKESLILRHVGGPACIPPAPSLPPVYPRYLRGF